MSILRTLVLAGTFAFAVGAAVSLLLLLALNGLTRVGRGYTAAIHPSRRIPSGARTASLAPATMGREVHEALPLAMPAL
jgi:hypothetical protein